MRPGQTENDLPARADRVGHCERCILYDCIIVSLWSNLTRAVQNAAGSNHVVNFYKYRGITVLLRFEENIMDETEKLIDLVHNIPYLYDKSHSEYKNVVNKAEKWNEIAGILNQKSE